MFRVVTAHLGVTTPSTAYQTVCDDCGGSSGYFKFMSDAQQWGNEHKCER